MPTRRTLASSGTVDMSIHSGVRRSAGSNGFAPNAISFGAMADWQRFYGVHLDPMEIDLILANPPFAGEIKDRKMLARYELARGNSALGQAIGREVRAVFARLGIAASLAAPGHSATIRPAD